jgi:hypothetical protein
MKEALAEYAKSLGFDICRVAKCEAPPHARAFETWLAAWTRNSSSPERSR